MNYDKRLSKKLLVHCLSFGKTMQNYNKKCSHTTYDCISEINGNKRKYFGNKFLFFAEVFGNIRLSSRNKIRLFIPSVSECSVGKRQLPKIFLEDTIDFGCRHIPYSEVSHPFIKADHLP